jgi:hypothetical protein
MRAVFSADRADEEETCGDHSHHASRERDISSIRTPPWPSRSPRRILAIRRFRWWCWEPPIPAKFPDAVEAACGVRPALPQWLANLDQRRERVTTLPVDPMAVERHILSRSRAAHEGAAA